MSEVKTGPSAAKATAFFTQQITKEEARKGDKAGAVKGTTENDHASIEGTTHKAVNTPPSTENKGVRGNGVQGHLLHSMENSGAEIAESKPESLTQTSNPSSGPTLEAKLGGPKKLPPKAITLPADGKLHQKTPAKAPPLPPTGTGIPKSVKGGRANRRPSRAPPLPPTKPTLGKLGKTHNHSRNHESYNK